MNSPAHSPSPPPTCSRRRMVSEADVGGKIEIIKVRRRANASNETVTLGRCASERGARACSSPPSTASACGLRGSGVQSQQYFSPRTFKRAHLPDLPHSAAAPRSIISIFCAGKDESIEPQRADETCYKSARIHSHIQLVRSL